MADRVTDAERREWRAAAEAAVATLPAGGGRGTNKKILRLLDEIDALEEHRRETSGLVPNYHLSVYTSDTTASSVADDIAKRMKGRAY